MSKITRHLVRDHRALEPILTGVEGLLLFVEEGGKDYQKDLAVLVDYMCDLATLKHEEKEESVLMPALVRLGFDWENGVLPHVRKEHMEERYLLRSLRQSARFVGDWDEDDRLHFVAIARELVNFTRKHMLAEEEQLFPSVDDILDADLDDKLNAQCEQVDREFEEVPDAERLHALATEVATRYRERGRGEAAIHAPSTRLAQNLRSESAGPKTS